MNRTTIAGALVSIGIVAAGLAGCAGTTRTGVAYTLKPDRELETFIAADLGTAHDAAVRTLRNKFRYRVTKQAADGREGIIEAFTAKGDTVRVETYYASPRVTKVEVFVGPLGDEPIMKDILDAIAIEAEKAPAKTEPKAKAEPSSTAPDAKPEQPKKADPKASANPPQPKPADAATTAKPATSE